MALIIKNTIKPDKGAEFKVVEPIDIDWKNQDTNWVLDLKDQLNISSENLEFNNILTKNQIESTLLTTIDEYQFEYDLVWTKYGNGDLKKVLIDESSISSYFTEFKKYNYGYQEIFKHFKTKLNNDKTQLNLDNYESENLSCYIYTHDNTYVLENKNIFDNSQQHTKIFTNNDESLNIYKDLNEITDIYRKSRIDLEKEISKYSWTSIKKIEDEQDKFEVEIKDLGIAINEGKVTAGGLDIDGKSASLKVKYNLFNEHGKPAFYTNDGYLVPKANTPYASDYNNDNYYNSSWQNSNSDSIPWIYFDHYHEGDGLYIKEVNQDSAYFNNKIPVVGEVDLGLKVVWDDNANKWITKAVITADMLEAVLGSVNIKVGNTDKNLADYLNTLSTKSELQTALSNLNIDDKIKSLNDVNNAYQEYENIKKEYDTFTKKVTDTYNVNGNTQTLLKDYTVKNNYLQYKKYFGLYREILKIWLYGKEITVDSHTRTTFIEGEQEYSDVSIEIDFDTINEELKKQSGIFIDLTDIDNYSFKSFYTIGDSGYITNWSNGHPFEWNKYFNIDGSKQYFLDDINNTHNNANLTGIIENYYEYKLLLESSINKLIYGEVLNTSANIEIHNGKILLLIDSYSGLDFTRSSGLYIDDDEAGLHIFYKPLRGRKDDEVYYVFKGPNNETYQAKWSQGGEFGVTSNGQLVYVENEGHYLTEEGGEDIGLDRESAGDVIKDSTIKIKATVDNNENVIKTGILLDASDIEMISNNIYIDAYQIRDISPIVERISSSDIEDVVNRKLAELSLPSSEDIEAAENAANNAATAANNSINNAKNLITSESITKELDEFVLFCNSKLKYNNESIELTSYPNIYNGQNYDSNAKNNALFSSDENIDNSLKLKKGLITNDFENWEKEYIKTSLIYRYILDHEHDENRSDGYLTITNDNNSNGYKLKILKEDSINYSVLYLVNDGTSTSDDRKYVMTWSNAKTAYKERYKRMQVIAKILKLYIEKFEYIDYVNNILKNYNTHINNIRLGDGSNRQATEKKLMNLIYQFYAYIILNELNSAFFDKKDYNNTRSVRLYSNWELFTQDENNNWKIKYLEGTCFNNIVETILNLDNTKEYKVRKYSVSSNLLEVTADSGNYTINGITLNFNKAENPNIRYSGDITSYNTYLTIKKSLDDAIDSLETLRGKIVIETANTITGINTSIENKYTELYGNYSNLSNSFTNFSSNFNDNVNDIVKDQFDDIGELIGNIEGYFVNYAKTSDVYVKTELIKAGEIYSTHSEAGLKVLFNITSSAVNSATLETIIDPKTGDKIEVKNKKEAYLKVKLKQEKYKHSYDNGLTYLLVYWKDNPFEYDDYNNIITSINLTQNADTSYGTDADFSIDETDWPVYKWNFDLLLPYKIPPLDYTSETEPAKLLDGYYKWKDKYAVFTDETAVDIDADELQAKVKDIKIDAENLVGKIKNVEIDSECINLNGLTTLNDGFRVNFDGNVEMQNANVGGWINGKPLLITKKNIGKYAYVVEDGLNTIYYLDIIKTGPNICILNSPGANPYTNSNYSHLESQLLLDPENQGKSEFKSTYEKVAITNKDEDITHYEWSVSGDVIKIMIPSLYYRPDLLYKVRDKIINISVTYPIEATRPTKATSPDLENDLWTYENMLSVFNNIYYLYVPGSGEDEYWPIFTEHEREDWTYGNAIIYKPGSDEDYIKYCDTITLKYTETYDNNKGIESQWDVQNVFTNNFSTQKFVNGEALDISIFVEGFKLEYAMYNKPNVEDNWLNSIKCIRGAFQFPGYSKFPEYFVNRKFEKIGEFKNISDKPLYELDLDNINNILSEWKFIKYNYNKMKDSDFNSLEKFCYKELNSIVEAIDKLKKQRDNYMLTENYILDNSIPDKYEYTLYNIVKESNLFNYTTGQDNILLTSFKDLENGETYIVKDRELSEKTIFVLNDNDSMNNITINKNESENNTDYNKFTFEDLIFMFYVPFYFKYYPNLYNYNLV